MSRSRKLPIHSITTAGSDKPFKVVEHRRERRHVRVLLHSGADDTHPSMYRVYGDPWCAPKDGKVYSPEWAPAYRK
jgi:hypothetical protein